jgi:histidinol dehydrogenase
VARVDKIVGPGNAWVAAAKAQVSRDCAIDLHAGPSEIVIWSAHGRPDWIAADLLAQAEHDPAARAILVTTSAALARDVSREVARQMPRTGPARTSIAQNGAIVVASSRRAAAAVVNELAPEHLVTDEAADANLIRTAGTIFVGPWSAQAAGDYATGSNHVLPTGGAGRFRGGLSAADFVRVFNVQTLTRTGIRGIGRSVVTLAEAEGLEAHAQSVRLRL